MKSLKRNLLANIEAFRNVLGVSKEELQALEKPAETIDNLLREIDRLKGEVERLKNALEYEPRLILSRCISCGTGHMFNSVDGFTCGEGICRDRAIDILVETHPARNGNKRGKREGHTIEV